MRILFFFLFLVSNSYLFSQIVFDKTKYDFGDLSSNSDRYVDIIVTNKGPKKAFLLSVFGYTLGLIGIYIAAISNLSIFQSLLIYSFLFSVYYIMLLTWYIQLIKKHDVSIG